MKTYLVSVANAPQVGQPVIGSFINSDRDLVSTPVTSVTQRPNKPDTFYARTSNSIVICRVAA
jgi:hypothetical protein